MKLPARIFLFFLIFLFGGAFLFWNEYRNFSDGRFHFHMFDIALGDALLLKTPHGKTVFIDGGIDGSVLQNVSDVLPFWQKEFELLVITHPDLDHLAGGLEVLKKYKVNHILLTGAASSSGAFAEFIREAQARRIPISFGKSETDFILDGILFDVLFPEKFQIGEKIKKVNETSLVLKASYGATSFLLTGDIEKGAETDILATPASLESTFLKVAHHGSRSSSTENFLKAVRPKYSAISASKGNRYGHPHEKILERIKTFSPATFVTRDHGDIEVISDGSALEILLET